MNKYEFVYIVDAHATQATKDEITKQVNDALAKSECKAVSSQVWFERQKMAFAINKVWEGTYYMLNIEASSAAINKFQALLRINEQVLRFLAIRTQAKKA